jgi:antitoxin ParD1/3/4
MTYGSFMSTVRKTITLTDQQDAWIKTRIEDGSECIRDLIRQEQSRSADIQEIRAALAEGEASGEPAAFDAPAFRQRMRAQLG